MSDPEPGDKVSWNWGGGAPGGTVAEKKTEGEIAITSKRGNKIKKNADKNDPAVHIERSGNDVVKRASELNVEKKGSKSSGGDKKSEGKADDKKKDGKGQENKGEKRKHDKVSKDEEEDDEDSEEPLVENEEGKEVKPGGKDANKKQKKDDKPAARKDDKPKSKKGENKEAANGEKQKEAKSNKNESGSKKQKKEPTPRKEGDQVSSRTRSRA